MPILSLQFDHAGRPTLELYVGVSAAEAEFRQPRPPVHVRALIDTGASKTNVVRRVLDRLGLSPVSQVPVHTASTGLTPFLADVYAVEYLAIRDDYRAPGDRLRSSRSGGSERLRRRGPAGSGHLGAWLVSLRRLGAAVHASD